MTTNLYAAVSSDGTRPVVWGLGSTPDEARADASRWLAECATTETGDDCEIHVISDAQAAIVRAGDVAWPVRA